ncbi:hypothetical protein AB4Z42_23005 [Mycobacterium sp. 2YAF39]|uniref:hypothetical protein n=1 Tax=Mycobacterium sp. 2YAF39 TaxID=3233033 RepID=UPI003F9CD019
MAKHRAVKHRSKRGREFVRKASIAGGAAATATAMTLGLAPPSSAALPTIPNIPGVNVITTGPPFGLLGIAGLNPFWVPALPSRIADEINGTSYLGGSDLDIPVPVDNPLYDPNCHRADCPPEKITGSLDLDLVSLRIPLVVGFGIGALAAGMAYPQVEADLPNQPGGTGPNAQPGSSVTIVPMLLLRNPGRNDGGVAARFAPFFAPFGIDTATNDFDVQTDGNAVLVPVKVDATVQNDPLSDFAAWPNPVTLMNNAAAFAYPTYILRGSDVSGIGLQTLNPLVANLVGNFGSALIGDGLTVNLPGDLPSVNLSREASILALNPILTSALADTFPGINVDIPNGPDPEDRYEALNQYLTLENGAQPMLEPFRYPTDLMSIATGQTITNPFADAVEPAISMLGNLGYTNVVQYGDDPNDFRDDYQRDFSNNFGSNGGEAMPFFSFPKNVNWNAVPADFVRALSGGFQDAFFSGGIPGLNNPPASQKNNPFGLLTGLVEQVIGPINLDSVTPGDLLDAIDVVQSDNATSNLSSVTPLAAHPAPDQNAQRMTVNADAATVSPTPPASGAAANNAPSTPAADTTTGAQRPRLNVWRGTMTPLAGDHGSSADNRPSGQSPVRDPVRETSQQIRGSVSDLVKNVTDVTRNLTRAATGHGPNGQGDNGASSQGDNDDSGE